MDHTNNPKFAAIDSVHHLVSAHSKDMESWRQVIPRPTQPWLSCEKVESTEEFGNEALRRRVIVWRDVIANFDQVTVGAR